MQVRPTRDTEVFSILFFLIQLDKRKRRSRLHNAQKTVPYMQFQSNYGPSTYSVSSCPHRKSQWRLILSK